MQCLFRFHFPYFASVTNSPNKALNPLPVHGKLRAFKPLACRRTLVNRIHTLQLYRLARPLLFSLAPELSHDITLRLLSSKAVASILRAALPAPVQDPVELMGCRFANRVGLAAGLDKNANSVIGLEALGFGFLEVGTVTPLAQPGNPRPRMFRLVEHEAIINRMGFNNQGLEAMLEKLASLASHRSLVPLGINIGKNKLTPADKAVDDYLVCLDAVYSQADYITINLSSPNTPGLRDLQFGEQLDALLLAIREKRKFLDDIDGKRTPVLVKIAPDMARDDLLSVVDRMVVFGFDGVIATNTTIDREAVQGSRHAGETGGLSGLPLYDASTGVVEALSGHLQGALCIVGVGGIHTPEQAVNKIRAGADLVQLYSGIIYRGPGLVYEAASAISDMRC